MKPDGLSVLYVGGTGTISASCVAESLARGMRVSVLNRGSAALVRPVPDGVEFLEGDVRDPASVRAALGDRDFDAVVNVTVFTAEQARTAVELFAERTRHYLHISTAAMYRKPMLSWPIVESSLRHNPFCAYARDKIAAEDVFNSAHLTSGFPVTLVRPSHTYDDARPPLPGGWAIVDRIARGRPIVVPGDGTSLWTVTHAEDFAVGLVGLLQNPAAIGETVHITSDFVYTWDQMYHLIARGLGTEARLVHVPSELIALAAPDWMWSELILGDLSHSALFDNTKIRRLVPEFEPRVTFPIGVRRFLEWRRGHPEFPLDEPEVDSIIDRLVDAYEQSRAIFVAAGATA